MEIWLQFAGRLHPVLLHLPIGILFVLVVLEAYNLVRRIVSGETILTGRARGCLVGAMALAMVVAALCGWLLAREADYNSELVDWHRISGLVSAVLAVLCYLFRQFAILYIPLLLLTVAGTGLAGHQGGSVTHGRDFLFSVFHQEEKGDDTATTPEPPGLGELAMFQDVVLSVFEERCVSCHGPDRQKGRLRLDSETAIQAGGRSGPVLSPGDFMESELIARILLPLDHEDRMPPVDKPQLTADQVILLEWWVATGAPFQGTMGAHRFPAAVERYLATEFGIGAEPVAPLPERRALAPLVAQVETATGAIITWLDPKEPWIEVNARLSGEAFADADLSALESLAPVIRRLDLGQTAITDEGLIVIEQMSRLEDLKLDRTRISDTGLASLSGLQDLKSLNLYGTPVTDRGLSHLAYLPQLRKVYVWESDVTVEGAQWLQRRLSNESRQAQLNEEAAAIEAELRSLKAEVNTGEAAIPDDPV